MHSFCDMRTYIRVCVCGCIGTQPHCHKLRLIYDSDFKLSEDNSIKYCMIAMRNSICIAYK